LSAVSDDLNLPELRLIFLRQTPESRSLNELLFVGGVGQGRVGLPIGKVEPNKERLIPASPVNLALIPHVTIGI
jgi:hypothetical protein